MQSNLIELIRLMNEKPIAFNKHYVFLGCGINGAVMLSQLVYWADKSKDPNGWIYKTGKEWTEETGLTRREQDTARKNLKELGFIEEHKHGVPCKVHFKVNQENLYNALINLAQKRQSDAQISQTECTKAPNWNGGKRQTNTENTTEITTNIKTHSLYTDEFEKFWQSVSNKDGKKAAAQAFKKAIKVKTVDELIEAYAANSAYCDSVKKFKKNPATWLNGECWNDESIKPFLNNSTTQQAQTQTQTAPQAYEIEWVEY